MVNNVLRVPTASGAFVPGGPFVVWVGADQGATGHWDG
jgi:hypothetical protein